MWFTFLAPLLGNIPGLIGQYFNKKADVELANVEYQKALAQAQITQVQEMAKLQLSYQTTALGSTSPIFKQHIFWFLSIPILLSVILPASAANMWHNLSLIPESYWTLYSAIVLTIWGIPVASGVVAKAFSGLSEYAYNKQSNKLEIQKVSGEQYKKALFDTIRAVKGPLSPKDVSAISKTLDELGDVPQ